MLKCNCQKQFWSNGEKCGILTIYENVNRLLSPKKSIILSIGKNCGKMIFLRCKMEKCAKKFGSSAFAASKPILWVLWDVTDVVRLGARAKAKLHRTDIDLNLTIINPILVQFHGNIFLGQHLDLESSFMM